MSDANRALMQRFYDEVISGGDVDALDELMVPDFVEHPSIGMSGPPSDQPVEWSAIHIFRVRDGRLTDRWGEANIGGLIERLEAP